MPPVILTRRFYELTLKRDFAEAERILARIKEKLSGSEWNKGYLRSLEGMLTANKTKDDDYLYINRLQSGKSNPQNLRKMFEVKAQSLVNSEYDRGFFSAWLDFVRYFKGSNSNSKSKELNLSSTDKAKEETVVQTNLNSY